MYATLIAAFVLAQAPTPAGQPPAGRSPGLPGHDTAAMSLDGNWTVVCLEKNGSPVADAKNLTVTVRNNVATFSDSNKQKAMRFEFAPDGRIRVTEMEGTGTGAGTGTGTGTTAAQPGRPGQPVRPGVGAPGSPAHNETKTGVYVLAKDYFAVSLHDTSARPGGERPGAPGTAPRPVPPAGVPGAAPPATQPGGGTALGGDFRSSVPSEKPAIVVILKRSEGGNGTTPRK